MPDSENPNETTRASDQNPVGPRHRAELDEESLYRGHSGNPRHRSTNHNHKEN